MSDDNIKSLNIYRAAAEGDCSLVTVEECLVEALKECRSGKKEWSGCLLLLKSEARDGDTWFLEMRASGLSTLELRGMIMSAIMDETADHVEGR